MTLIIGFLLSIAVFYIVPKSKNIIAVCLSCFIIAVIAYHLTEKNQYDLVYHRQLYDTIMDGGFSSAVVYSQIDRSPLYIWLVYEGVHSMFLRKKNLKFFCCSFEKNVFLRMCIQQQMRMFSMSH